MEVKDIKKAKKVVKELSKVRVIVIDLKLLIISFFYFNNFILTL